MKRLIVKTWISLAEVFDWRIPIWVRRLLPKQEVSDLLDQEQNLTRALRGATAKKHSLPPHFEQRIEARVREEQPTAEASWNLRPALGGLVAVAAILVAGIFLWTGIEPSSSSEELTEAPEMAQAEESPPAEDRELPLDRLSLIASEDLSEDFLLRPLTKEQAYLAADLTNAVIFVAESVVPSEYMPRVRSGLRSIELKME